MFSFLHHIVTAFSLPPFYFSFQKKNLTFFSSLYSSGPHISHRFVFHIPSGTLPDAFEIPPRLGTLQLS
ncbi:hypothetical protein P8452_78070 [Trifolium repens]|nr:hypothetical protein P8452_78070 [Trifolium repens]